ncbi:MAG: DUF3108 domain-containing protein [Pseudomonadota bacterium]
MISRRRLCSVALIAAFALPLQGFNDLTRKPALAAKTLANEAASNEVVATLPDHNLELGYEVWLGGLHVFSFDTALARQGKEYAIDMTARTDGLVGKVYPYEMQVEAKGKDQGSELRPKQFRLAYQAPGRERARAMVYRPDGWKARKDPASKNYHLPQFDTVGTLDPASAALSIIEVLGRQGSCSGELSIFDGKRRYDLSLSHQGETELGKSKYGIYAGPATKCQIQISRGDGFGNDGSSFGTRFPSEVTVWMAPVLEGEPDIPVRFEAESAFGVAIIHLVKAEKPTAELTQAS